MRQRCTLQATAASAEWPAPAGAPQNRSVENRSQLQPTTALGLPWSWTVTSGVYLLSRLGTIGGYEAKTQYDNGQALRRGYRYPDRRAQRNRCRDGRRG